MQLPCLRPVQRQLPLPTRSDADSRRHYAQSQRETEERVPGLRCHLPGQSGLRGMHQRPIEWTSADGRASRRSVAPPSHLDVDPPGTGGFQTQKAVDRTGLRHHQGATGGASILAARPRQCSSRVDPFGDRVQPEDPLAHMALRRCWLPALQPGISTHSLSVAPGSVNTASSTVGMAQLMQPAVFESWRAGTHQRLPNLPF